MKLAVMLLLLLFPRDAGAQPKLKYTVIVTRHGVRSPTAAIDQLGQYSADPWPDFGVEPGGLTKHGHLLMQQFGAYDREYFRAVKLFSPGKGCSDAAHVTVYADNSERTRETAHALAEGMLPGCDVKVLSASEDTTDPIFNPLGAGLVKGDKTTALAAVAGRIGDQPKLLAELYRGELEELARVSNGTPPGAGSPKRAWLDAPITVTRGKGDTLVDITGSLRTASTLTENLLLEYTNGFSGKQFAWGRLDEEGLTRLMVLHTAYADLARRTPYVARARGSNLLAHILTSIRQATSGKAINGALGKPSDAVLFVVGHDTNISNLSGMLGLSWLLPGYQPIDAVPGGALVFELWQGEGAPFVRTYYSAQSLRQMHDAAPLTLQAPPLKAPVFVPGCSALDCSWPDFQRVVESAVDRASVGIN